MPALMPAVGGYIERLVFSLACCFSVPHVPSSTRPELCTGQEFDA
jgi:hypothetical protein